VLQALHRNNLHFIILSRDFYRARRNKGVTWRYKGVTSAWVCLPQFLSY
jgi:hypothetical protein